MRRSDLVRYALWGAVAFTAAANRNHYRMATTWLPHLLTNTLSLLLPDVVRPLLPQRAKQNKIDAILRRMIAENDSYALYVTPLAMGYILSHPNFNIYKGELAEIRAAGFGLDAIPHSTTAMALTLLVIDTLRVVSEVEESGNFIDQTLDWSAEHNRLFSLGVLAALTFLWEYGEYRIHQHELGERGDAALINMQWSAEDTRSDVISNLTGWAAGVLMRR